MGKKNKSGSSGLNDQNKPTAPTARQLKEQQLGVSWTKEELDLFSDEELDKLIEEVQALANKNYKEKHAEKVRKEFEKTQKAKALAEEKAQKAKAKAEKEKRQQEEARKKAAKEAKKDD